ncbi:hypothetical protein LF934_07485 [Dickeya dadantii]|nr:hypothetical protein [Dickeya dadantii]
MTTRLNPFYRRGGNQGRNSGLREKIAWQLSKRPMSGQELADILNVPLPQLRSALSHIERQTAVMELSISDWQIIDGIRDRVYTLVRVGQRARPKASQAKKIIISARSASNENPDARREGRKRARELARRIADGTYHDFI